jgi:photosystem II stability/assembly factor-like uncharacterized protein
MVSSPPNRFEILQQGQIPSYPVATMHYFGPRIVLLLVLGLGACQATPLSEARWHPSATGTTSSLRGLHAVDANTVWASGSRGTVLRSTDAGQTFELHVVSGAEGNEMRDIHGFDADTAFVIGCQPARVYRTTDGGRTFEIVLDANNGKAFFDGLSFFDRARGVVFGDPVGDRFMVYTTVDGGSSWQRVKEDRLPLALPGEGGFAASGTCLTVGSNGEAWIGTGIAGARVMRSKDDGRSWGVAATPMSHGEAAGVFSLAFRNGSTGVAVGGDYRASKESRRHAVVTSDGGRRWFLASVPPRKFRSCAVYVPGRVSTLVAVGPSGTDYSTDDGNTWQALSDVGFHVVSFAPDGTGFAAGSRGRVARLVFTR